MKMFVGLQLCHKEGSLPLKAICKSIIFLSDSINKHDCKLVKQALLESNTLSEQGSKTWYTKLENLNKIFPTQVQQPGMTKFQKKKINKSNERSLQNKYEEFWLQQINLPTSRTKNRGGNKLRTYNRVKQNFGIEQYLTLISNSIHRASMTKLRISCHPLNIEILRGKVSDPNLRVCQVCNLNEPEDEFHFLMICPVYERLRDALNAKMRSFPQVHTLDKDNKAIWLLTNEDKELCNLTATYITNSLKLRNEITRGRTT